MENEQFAWKNSYGSTKSIRYIFKEIKANEETEEYDDDWEAELSENDEDDSDLEYSNEYQNELRKQRAESRVLKEENLVSEILHKRIMLISDNPGTGKSTTITKLYEAKAIAD
ncbi:hypothetical protein, partial [Micromonospora noduli]|uniref:hypothetical protein n=1 Tax=Micromonospora noduli TaxID=709876 RepID=UPI001B88308F